MSSLLSAAHFCRPLEGVREWLDTLGRFNVPCALVSALDRKTVQVINVGDPSIQQHARRHSTA